MLNDKMTFLGAISGREGVRCRKCTTVHFVDQECPGCNWVEPIIPPEAEEEPKVSQFFFRKVTVRDVVGSERHVPKQGSVIPVAKKPAGKVGRPRRLTRLTFNDVIPDHRIQTEVMNLIMHTRYSFLEIRQIMRSKGVEVSKRAIADMHGIISAEHDKP